MTMTNRPPESAQELRRRAEEFFRANKSAKPKTLSTDDVQQLLHELQVHQIELEIQNEELRRLQAGLEASQARFFDLYDLAPVGYLTLSENGLIREANLAAATMLGVTRSTLVKQPVSRFILKEDKDIFYLQRKQCFESNAPVTWDMRLIRPDDSLFWAHLQIKAARKGEYWITFNDITERKRVEEELRESKSLVDAVVENVPLMIFLKEATDLRFVIFNRAGEELLGHDREVLLGKNNLDLFPPEQAANFMIKDREVLDGEAGILDIPEEPIMTARKGLRFLHTRKVCIRGHDGVTKYLLGISEDITERKCMDEERQKLEQQFQQAQKLESLGVLAGGIAHDFNNILTVIICNCSLLLKRPQMAEELVPEIEIAAQRAADLCRQMLIYAGKAQPVPTRVNMAALVDEMAKMLKATINQNVVIKVLPSADIPSIKADASQIRQIVMNLIINASEAIGAAQGIIRVSLVQSEISEEQPSNDHLGNVIAPGWYVCLEVKDNGCGMDEETRRRIFEPFYTTKFTGRGLGMSAVLGIIKAHNGALQLFSQPGQGTTFKVYLPLQSSEDTGEESLKPVSSVPWQGNGTILLVEDEPQLVMVAKMLLKALGFSVIEAINGKEALELYQKNAEYITLVMTDIGMPVMDGYELFRELKKLNPELPIIITSGFGDAGVTSQIPREEIAGLLSKPYNFDQLREVLRRVVEPQ